MNLYCSLSRRNRTQIKHTCLGLDEIPKPGTLVAIDAEFIALQLVRSQRETLVRIDSSL